MSEFVNKERKQAGKQKRNKKSRKRKDYQGPESKP